MSLAARVTPSKKRKVQLRILQAVPYEEAVVLQESYVKSIAEGVMPEQFLLLEHPHVMTLGRGFHKENLLFAPEWLQARGIEVVESGRGGDVTYHGPGQVVGYPLLDLSDRPDLHLYLRNLEELMVRCLADFGIPANRKDKLTGVWVDNEKVGAIGVRVTRWITSHGFALNVNTDLKYFEYIVPCGISDHGVTSMQKLTGKEISPTEVHDSLMKHFQTIFNRTLVGNG